MNLTTATPAEIDAELAKALAKREQISKSIDSALEYIHTGVGDDKVRQYGTYCWGLSDADAIAKAEAGDVERIYASYAERGLASYREGQAALVANDAEVAPFNAEFTARGGWTRAYLATSKDGHIHSSRGCSTCRMTTTFWWFTDLSGHDESEIVTKAGSDACTVCYPTAPVNDLKRPRSIFSDDEIAAAQARKEREEAKAAREAKRLAKALLPTGDKVGIPTAHGRMEDITTLAAARKVLTDAFQCQSYGYNGYTEWIDSINCQLLAEMIASKEGKTTETVLAEAKQRAAKRR